jgi:hypothetical protein
MSYKVNLEGLEGHDIEVRTNFWTGTKLFIDGQAAPKGKKRGEMILQRNDGSQVVAAWKAQALGFDVPQLAVDGKTIKIVEPLKWYQWVWSGLPILLIFGGGALGAIAGVIAFYINSQIFRSELNAALKYGLTFLVSVVVFVVYLIVAIMIRMSLNN